MDLLDRRRDSREGRTILRLDIIVADAWRIAGLLVTHLSVLESCSKRSQGISHSQSAK